MSFFGTLSEDDAFSRKASYIARLGSGSACRSVYERAAIWGKTIYAEGSSDDYAIAYGAELHEVFNNFHDDILIVSDVEKSVSSTSGHALMNDNIYASNRYQQARQRMQILLEAMKDGDLKTFGSIVENEALTLHGLMMLSNPAYLLMKPNSIKIIEAIRAFRADTGHHLYFTLDAGPNIHLLYPEEILPEIEPFIQDSLISLCHEGQCLRDYVGEGPLQL